MLYSFNKLFLFCISSFCSFKWQNISVIQMSDSTNLVDLKTAADLEEFIKKNKKVMVEYFMEWCGPCRRVKHKYIVSYSNCLHSINLQHLLNLRKDCPIILITLLWLESRLLSIETDFLLIWQDKYFLWTRSYILVSYHLKNMKSIVTKANKYLHIKEVSWCILENAKDVYRKAIVLRLKVFRKI